MTFRVPDPQAVDLAELRRSVAGHQSRIPRAHAMRILAASPFPDRHRDLEAVLMKKEESTALRALAATLLGRQGDDRALHALIEHADITVPDVLEQVVRVIGQIGNRAAFAALDRISATASGWVAAQAKFSAALIAHRHGHEVHTVSLPEPARRFHMPSESRLPVSVGTPDETDLASSLAGAAAEPYGIEYDERRAVQLDFEGDRWMLLLNRSLRNSERLRQLATRKAFLGVVMERTTIDLGYALSLLILSTPTGDGRGIRVHLHDVDGVLLYMGDAGLESNDVLFSLGTVARPIAIPLEMQGRLTDGGARFTTVFTASLPGRKRHVRRDVHTARPNV